MMPQFMQIRARIAFLQLKIRRLIVEGGREDKGRKSNCNNEGNTMINSRKEVDFPLKQEGLSSSVHEKAKASSSFQWLKLKDNGF